MDLDAEEVPELYSDSDVEVAGVPVDDTGGSSSDSGGER